MYWVQGDFMWLVKIVIELLVNKLLVKNHRKITLFEITQ